jgi:thiol-disulfide isomerase/thioredoxin
MAMPYDEFLKTDPENATRWHDYDKRLPDPTDEQAQRVQGYGRQMKVLVYAGVWCGDCVRQGPMFRKLSEAAGDDLELRFIDRDASQELKDEVRILGATRVPIVIFLTEDYWEIAREGDRLLHIYKAKASRGIGRKFDGGILTPKAVQEEQAEWLDRFERALIMARLAPPLRQRHND